MAVGWIGDGSGVGVGVAEVGWNGVWVGWIVVGWVGLRWEGMGSVGALVVHWCIGALVHWCLVLCCIHMFQPMCVVVIGFGFALLAKEAIHPSLGLTSYPPPAGNTTLL